MTSIRVFLESSRGREKMQVHKEKANCPTTYFAMFTIFPGANHNTWIIHSVFPGPRLILSISLTDCQPIWNQNSQGLWNTGQNGTSHLPPRGLDQHMKNCDGCAVACRLHIQDRPQLAAWWGPLGPLTLSDMWGWSRALLPSIPGLTGKPWPTASKHWPIRQASPPW